MKVCLNLVYNYCRKKIKENSSPYVKIKYIKQKTYTQKGTILMDIIQQVIEIITKEYYENLEELVNNKEYIADFIIENYKRH